jgi:hypothetical protein
VLSARAKQAAQVVLLLAAAVAQKVEDLSIFYSFV